MLRHTEESGDWSRPRFVTPRWKTTWSKDVERGEVQRRTRDCNPAIT